MKKVIETLTGAKNDNVDVQRRRFQRRAGDTCMITVEGRAYPVQDWSMSGVLFEADTRTFNEGASIPMTLRFRLGDAVSNVDVTGNIVRKNARYIATQFDPLSSLAQQTLHQVIDESANAQDAQTQQN
ncbi:MAG: hypothetical protein COB76_02975 [Alphaproteobacteria bacterium]|nr:MAG: hypothetical protein COB76_02975 [Alphaproteobacteria bacterium]